MRNPYLDNETPEQRVERQRLMVQMMALPVGERAPGQVSLTYYDYAKFAAELAPYRPRRYAVEIWPAIAAAAAGTEYLWYVTADLTEDEYRARIWRPWRERTRAGGRSDAY